MTKADFFSSDEWIKTQSEVWNNWLELLNKGMSSNNKGGGSESNFAPWAKQRQWWQEAFATHPPEAQDIYNRIMEASKSYFSMAESFTKAQEEGMTLQQVIANWVDLMSKSFEGITPDGAVSEAVDPFQSFMNIWDLPQDTWQRTASTMFPFSGDFLRALRPEGVTHKPGDIHGHMDQFLATPALGYTREFQGQYQKLNRLFLNYQKELNNYMLSLSKVNMESLQLFQKEMQNVVGREEGISSIKDIYDIWVDCCEEVYAEYAMSETYAEEYGKLVNSLMAVKSQAAKITDEVLETFNIPTRKELNTLHKRVQEVRRDYNKMRSGAEDLKIEGIRNELDELQSLKSEVKTLKAQIEKITETKKSAKVEKKPLKAAKLKAKPKKKKGGNK